MRTESIASLPLAMLTCTQAGGELVPPWLTAHDRPWLRDLLLTAEAHAGCTARELQRAFRHHGAAPHAGPRQAAARFVLLQLLWPRVADRHASGLRRELFALAADGTPRQEALAAVADRHMLSVGQLTGQLFADLPHARGLVWPSPAPTTSLLLLATNRAIAMAMVATAERAELQLVGGARTVLRTAWLLGTQLLAADGDAANVRLRWQRPAGDRGAARRLAALVPQLPWTRQFELRATCEVRGRRGTFVLTSHDEILPGPEPRPFDSELERCFARDFALAAPAWELLREPRPLPCGDQLAFPDFLARRRGESGGFWIEIAGLRDPAALPGKLALLAQHPHYLLCLPRRLASAELLAHARVIPFSRRIDVADVLARMAVLPRR